LTFLTKKIAKFVLITWVQCE